MTCGIYRLINKRTSETYVGQSKNVDKRIASHFEELKNNTHHNRGMQQDWNDGDEFDYELLEETSCNRKVLNEREMIWIVNLNTFYEGYNRTPGGIYDNSKGNIDKGGERLPRYKYKSYSKVISYNDEQPPEVLFYEGTNLYEDGEYIKAIECFDNAIKQDDFNVNLLYKKEQALKNLNDYYGLINCYDELIDYDTKFYLDKGLILAELNKHEEAVKCFDKLLVYDEFNEEASDAKDKSLRKLDKSKNLDDVYKSDSITSNENINYHYNFISSDDAYINELFSKAYNFHKLSLYDDALEYYDRVLNLNPNEEAALYNKGRILSLSFRPSKRVKALNCFNKLLELDPNNQQYLKAKISILKDSNNKKELLKCYRKLLELDPYNFEARKNIKSVSRAATINDICWGIIAIIFIGGGLLLIALLLNSMF